MYGVLAHAPFLLGLYDFFEVHFLHVRSSNAPPHDAELQTHCDAQEYDDHEQRPELQEADDAQLLDEHELLAHQL